MVFSKTKSYGQAYANGWAVDYQIEIPDCIHRTEALKGVIRSIEREIVRERDTAAYSETYGAGTCATVEPSIPERVSKLETRVKFLEDRLGYR